MDRLKVSIIIPSYNGQHLLAKHLPAVIKASPNAEIIIVDDGSTDNTEIFLSTNFPQIKIVALIHNQRFAKACNAGVAAASGDIIILLNNDVSPELNFLESLIPVFRCKNVFAVGCLEKQKFYLAGRSGGNFTRGLFTHWRCQDQFQTDTLWVSGGSGAFNKSIWHQLGGFDPNFAPAYEEDRDLSYRALKHGYLIKFCPKSVVYHQHESTNQQTLGKTQMQLSAHKNNLLFTWKNITSPSLLIQHLFWLPYHLIFSSIKTRGIFLLAFGWALIYLPNIIHIRRLEKIYIKVSDEQLIHQYNQT